jgi:hypothetical protein
MVRFRKGALQFRDYYSKLLSNSIRFLVVFALLDGVYGSR